MAQPRRFHHTRNRILLSRLLGVLAVLLAFATRSQWLAGGWTEQILAWAGLLLVVGGAFGRLLSTLFIGGRKTHELVTDGPYGLTRNPLYFFSFLAVTGLGLASANPAVLILVVAAFALYYPGVLTREEEKLGQEHPEAFAAYRQQVPRFWPRLGNWQEPQWVEASPRKFRQAGADAAWFVVVYIVLRAIAEAHATGALPAYPLPIG